MAAVALKRAYLAAYNWAVFFGWAQVLYYAATTLLSMGHEGVYAAVERPLQLAQTAAVLEILHGLVGLVRSPVSAMLPQIGSRLFVTWGILWSFPETRTHMLVSSLVISWSITEVFRVAVLQAAAVRGDQGRARQHQNRGSVPRHPRPSSPPRLLSLPPCGSTPRPSSEGVGVDSSASSNANHSFCKPPKSSPNFRQWTTCYLHSSYKVGQSETNGANLKTREAPFSKSISYYTCRSSIM